MSLFSGCFTWSSLTPSRNKAIMWEVKTFSITVYHYTRGSQEIKPPICYFMLFTCLTCKNFTELHYNIAEGTVSFQGSHHLCLHSFLPLQTQACVPTHKIVLPLLQPQVHSMLQCPITGVIMSSLASFFKGPSRW